MRHIYLDEAGISENGVEPYLVVAAAITNPDRHWHDIVNYYDDLAKCWLPDFEPVINGHFVFHAKDVWHGSGLFPRERFSILERMQIFRQLAQAPDLLAIPICHGTVSKERLPQKDGESEAHRRILLQGLAFNIAMQQVDGWMETHCPGQVAMVTAEDTDTVKRALQLFHSSPQTDGAGYAHENTTKFLTRTIVDTINFAPKLASPIMQMADHCAFILRRSHSDCRHIDEYLKIIKRSVYTLPDKNLRPLELIVRAT